MLQYWLAQLILQPPQLLLFSSSFPPWLPMTGTQPLCAHPGLPLEPFQGLLLIRVCNILLVIFKLTFCSGLNCLQWPCSHLTRPHRASGQPASPGRSCRGWSPWPPPPWPTSTLIPSPSLSPILNVTRLSYISSHCRCHTTMFFCQLNSAATFVKVPSRHLALSTKKKSDEETAESESSEASAIPIVDHDPVAAYVQQLVSCYSNLANFYYDRLVV